MVDNKTKLIQLSVLRFKQTFVIWMLIYLGYFFIWTIPLYIHYPYSDSSKFFREKENTEWYIVPLFILVLMVYFNYYEKREYDRLFAAIAFVLFDIFNELWNSAYYHVTNGYGAVWMAQKKSAYKILIGWNIEILFNFLLQAPITVSVLSRNKLKTIWGLNNRHFYAFLFAAISVVVEMVFYQLDMIVWKFKWWNLKFPFLIWLNGYLPYWEISYLVFDSNRKNQMLILSIIGTIDLLLFFIFYQIDYL